MTWNRGGADLARSLGGGSPRRRSTLRRRRRFALEALEERVVLSVDLSQLGGFLPAKIGEFQTGVNNHAYQAGLPLLGKLAEDAGLAGNPFRFLDQIQQDLASGLSGMTAATTEAEFINRVQSALAAPANNGLGVPLNVSVARVAGGAPLAPATTSVVYAFGITPMAGQFLSKNVELAADLGLPGLGIGLGSLSADLALRTSFALNFRISLDSAGNTAVDVSAGNPSLAVNGAALLAPGSGLGGSVGLLSFDATVKPGAGLTNLGYNVDLSTFASTVTFAAQLPLKLTASFGGSAINPTVTADFNLSWSENAPINADVASISGLGGAGGGPSASFDNIQMDIKSGFLDNLAGPLLNNIRQFTAPVEPIIAAFDTKPFKDFGGPVKNTTVLDLLQLVGVVPAGAIPYFEAVKSLVQLGKAANGPGLGALNLGGFELTDVRQSASSITQPTTQNVMAQLSSKAPAFYQAMLGVNNGKVAPDPDPAKKEAGLDLKLLRDPMLFFQLFVGGLSADTQLFTFTLPDLRLAASVEKTLFTIPAPPPLTPFVNAQFGVRGGIGLEGHLSLGYDASGLLAFKADRSDPAKLFDGFYIDTTRPLLTIGGYTPDPAHPNDPAYGTIGGALASIYGGIFIDSNPIRLLLNAAGVDPPSWLGEAIDAIGELAIGLSANVTAHLDLTGAMNVRLVGESGQYGPNPKFRLNDIGAGGCIFNVDGFIGIGGAVDGTMTISAKVPFLSDIIGVLGAVIGQEWDIASYSDTYNVTFYTFPTYPLFTFAGTCGAQGQNGGQIPEEVLHPKLGTLDPATGALTLNMAKHRGARALRPTATGESFTLLHVSGSPDDPGGETIRIAAFGVTDEYSGVKSIIFEGDDGAVTLIIDDEVLSPSFLTGGTGGETLKAGGGASVIAGGGGDDRITGSLKTDTITVGEGGAVVDARDGDNNIIITGAGSKQITGGGGYDTVREAGDLNFSLAGGTLTGYGTAKLKGIENVELTGGAGANTFTVSGWTGRALLVGLGGNDSYIINFVGTGTTNYIIVDSSGDDALTVNGTNFADELLVQIGLVTRANERVSFSGVEHLTVDGGAGRDRINVRETAAGTTTQIFGGADSDLIRVSSRAGLGGDGDLSGVRGTLWVDAGGGGANRLILDNFAGLANQPAILRTAANGYMAVDQFAPASIYFKADGGAYFEFPVALAVNMPGYDPDFGVILRGSNTSDDEFRIRATLKNATTKVEGNGGDDLFIVSANDLSQPGDLSGILGALTLDGGLGAYDDGTPASNLRGLISLDRAIVSGDANMTLRDVVTRLKNGQPIPDWTAAEALLSATLAGTGAAVAPIRLRSVETAELRGGPSGNRMDGSDFSGNLILRGGSGNDTLIGGSGINDIDGGEGDNILLAGSDRLAHPGVGSQNQTVAGGGGISTLRGGGSGRNTFYATLNGTATLIGGSGENLFIIANPAVGLVDPVGGITIEGAGKPTDVLRLEGGGGAGYNQTYLLGPTPGAGNIVTTNSRVPDGPTISQFIRFSGIGAIIDSILANKLAIVGEGSASPIGGITSADLAAGALSPTIGGLPFGTITFANKTAPMVQLADGGLVALPPPPAPLVVAPASPAIAPAPLVVPPAPLLAAPLVAAEPVVVEAPAALAPAPIVAGPGRRSWVRPFARRLPVGRMVAARPSPARQFVVAPPRPPARFAAPRPVALSTWSYGGSLRRA